MIKPLSYSCCATLIVFFAEKRNLRAASCCKVLVVKGGFGFEVLGFSLTLLTVHFPFSRLEISFSASFLFSINDLEFFILPVSESKSLLDIILFPLTLLSTASNMVSD